MGNTLIFFNIPFYLNDKGSLSLDRNCKHCKARFLVRSRSPNIKETLSIIDDIKSCIKKCNLINCFFDTHKNLEYFNLLNKDYFLTDDEIEIIYNSVIDNLNHIFSFNDLNYLRRLLTFKINAVKKYENIINTKYLL